MLRWYILFSLTCLLIFKTSNVEAIEVIASSGEDIIESIACTYALQENKYFTETEEEMKRRGYSKFYIAGFDHAMENLRLAESLKERLRDPSINSETLHIPEFAALIDTHIAVVEDSLRYQYSFRQQERLEQLELFKSEAQHRKNSKTVTYRWWFNFNLRLSVLVTPMAHLKNQYLDNYIEKWRTNDGLEEFYAKFEKSDQQGFWSYILNAIDLLNRFPERIMIPTIHNLGIMSINKLYGTGVHLIGLNGDYVYADEYRMYPDRFFYHDIEHASSMDIDNSQLLLYFQQKLTGLPKYQRKAVEYIFFELTFESAMGLSFFRFTDSGIREQMRRIISAYYNYSYSDNFLLNFVYNYLNQIYDDDRFRIEGPKTFIQLISDLRQEPALLE